MNLLESFVIGISMYSKIPMWRVDWNEKNMKYALCFFPVVGVVIGCVSFLVGNLLLHIGCNALCFAGSMTLLPILISGGIHMDGFMDTMDARSSYGDRERKLEILKDSHAGAFAILGLGCYLVFSLAVWSEVTKEKLPVIAAGFVLSRAMSGFSVVNFRAARTSGLGKTFQDGAQKRRVSIVMILWFLLAGAGMVVVGGILGCAAILAALLVFWYYHHVAMKEFGGMTGDLAGYFLELCELMIVVAVVLAGGLL